MRGKPSNRIAAEQSRRDFLWKFGTVPLLAQLSQGLPAAAERKAAPTAMVSEVETKGEDLSSGLLTFDQVQKNKHEVSYDEVASLYGGPMSKHPVVSVKAHPEVIWVRPDMGIGMVANPFTFGVGDRPQQVRWREVRRSLEAGYLPIVTSRWHDGFLLYEQLAFSILVGARKVRTGHEKQLAMVQMSVINTNPSEGQHGVFWAFVPGAVAAKGVPPPPYDTYDFFDVTGSLPAVLGKPITPTDNILRNGSALIGIHLEDPGIRTTACEKVLRFEMDLRPGEKKSIRLEVSSNAQGFSATDIQNVRKIDFLSAHDQRVLELREILAHGCQIRVPEELVNNVYKAQILYNQPQMVQAADRSYYMPVLGYKGVWPWEEMKMLIPLDAMGYHEDVTKSLEYFLKMQDKAPPNGNVNGYRGYFSGTGVFEESGWDQNPHSTIYGLTATLNKGKYFPGWMNWTGAVLYAFGEHYFYANDAEGLRRVAPALVRACDWIINVRQQTKQRDSQGQKVLQYGLMPAGEPYDVMRRELANYTAYYFCFTDGYTYQGLNRVSEALAEIGHPEGQRLLKEAEQYRQDILEVMRRTRQLDPALPPYPDHLYDPLQPGWADFAGGALSLVDTGLIDPHDPAFVQLEDYMKKHYNRDVVGLTGGLRSENNHHAPNSYYVNISEDIWQRGWMLRGEIEKSLLSFYSIMAFGVDKETLGAVERFDLLDQRFAPFFMDASGASRVVGMIRQTLIWEHGNVLYLLGGSPRRWLEAGKKIEISGAAAYFGKLNLGVDSQADEGRILLSLELEKRHPQRLRQIQVRVPHPQTREIREVMINGRRWTNFDRKRELIMIQPAENRYAIVVQY